MWGCNAHLPVPQTWRQLSSKRWYLPTTRCHSLKNKFCHEALKYQQACIRTMDGIPQLLPFPKYYNRVPWFGDSSDLYSSQARFENGTRHCSLKFPLFPRSLQPYDRLDKNGGGGRQRTLEYDAISTLSHIPQDI